jgi:ABC-type Na+ efflux pump permease subunit
MIAVMLMSVALIAGLCVLAYILAVYALPFMLAVEAARFAYATGSGLIGAGLVGLVAGAAAYGLLVFAFASPRSPVLRLIVALVFAAPAAVAGYALVHGVTREAVPSEIWRQIFCIIGAIFVGISALMRLSAPLDTKSS